MKIKENTNLKHLKDLPFFGLVAFMQLSGLNALSAKQKLSRWAKSGEILRLKNGLYINRDFYLAHREKEWFSLWVSSIMQPTSYVSREWVLQKHGILTELTYPVTAMSVKNTRAFRNLTGTYRYYHLQPALFTGYLEKNYYGATVREASKAKALFDYLYSKKASLPNIVEQERLNLEDFNDEERVEFAKYIELAASHKMNLILADLRSYVWS